MVPGAGRYVDGSGTTTSVVRGYVKIRGCRNGRRHEGSDPGVAARPAPSPGARNPEVGVGRKVGRSLEYPSGQRDAVAVDLELLRRQCLGRRSGRDRAVGDRVLAAVARAVDRAVLNGRDGTAHVRARR